MLFLRQVFVSDVLQVFVRRRAYLNRVACHGSRHAELLQGRVGRRNG